MSKTVTATEFQRNVGVYTDSALREPVIITNHNRERLVLLAAEDYHRLKRMDDRVACHPADLPDDLLQALDESISKDDAEDIRPTEYPIYKF